jgi:hypothetical protein
MKFRLGREPAAQLDHEFRDLGVAFSLSQVASDWWSDLQRVPERLRPAAAYLGQLLNEGVATAETVAVFLPWAAFYALQADPDHAGSLRLLALPETGDWAPCLESKGTPSESNFVVAVVAWQSSLAGRRSLDRAGATVGARGERWLLTQAAWRTSVAVDALAQQSSQMSPEQRMRALGEIRSNAIEAGASLDDYLERTNIVSPNKVEIELRRQNVLGVPVVEVRPHLDGAPDGFVDVLDQHDSVRDRYDITQPDGGLVHVLPSPAVRAALTAIKSMPGRRLASEEARLFGHNPYAVLGEDAREALDEDALIRARQDADLLPYRLAFHLDSDGAAPSIQLVPVSESTGGASFEVSPQLARSLLEISGKSRARSLPLFHWEGYEIELSSVTEQALTQLAKWLTDVSMASVGLTFAEVMNLEAYSDRVIGFDARVQTVPYVAKRDSDAGWIPENVEAGIVAVDRDSGAVQNVAMPAQAIAELQDRVAKAIVAGSAEVMLPNSNVSVSLERAQQLAETLQSAEISVGKRKTPVSNSSDPKNEGKRSSLQILHNIESLDYGTSTVAAFSPSALADRELPDALRSDVSLLPHQEEGLAWLQHRYGLQAEGMTGCLLADDMGLGKTLQSLCLIAWHDERTDHPKPSLIVAPVSLLENWKLEITKFLGWSDDDVLSLYGGALAGLRLTPALLDADLANAGIRKLLRPEFEAGYKVVLTTYETLRDYEFSLARVAWGVVVCDEAQKIKNPAAFVTQAAKALRADFRIACTGTPVENSLADLWCLFDFFQPGYLGSLNDFTKKFRRDIETRAEGHSALVERLRTATKPWVLRRMKNEVHRGLPDKLEREQADASSLAIPMSAAQSKMYAEAVSNYRASREAGAGGSGAQILALLSKLRMICAHPLSVMSDDHEVKPLSEHLKASPKLAWLMTRLDEIRSRNEKVIVFTEFRDLQRLVQRAVAERFGYAAQIINGSTTVDSRHDESRQRLIDKFQAQAGFGVIILSTTAVGFGVNIQAANHVVHFTRPWNPAKEDQATDRAYRIGQTKDVFVYCPTVVGPGYESFEERLAKLLEGKRELSRDMLAGTQEITAEDFVDL